MSALPNQSYANLDNPYWLKNPVPYLEISGTPSVVLTNDGGVLEVNGVPITGEPVSNWYEYPTANRIILFGDDPMTQDNLQAIDGFLYFNGELLAEAGQISNVGDWALYPALSNVNMNGSNIFNVCNVSNSNNLTVTGNGVTISGDNFVIISNAETNPAFPSSVLVEAKDGTGGTLNLRADKGLVTGGAVVNIEALAGDIAGYGWGGTVNIKAYSAPSIGLTSKVTIEGAGVNSYAGAVPTIGSLAGYNFIFGNVGVNICAGVPSIFPNTPLTTYIYGTAGVTIESGLLGDVQVKDSDFGTRKLVPYYSALATPSNLVITGRSNVILANQYVVMSMVNNIDFESNAVITGLKSMTMSNGVICNVSNINLSNINGVAYSPTSNWATFPALANVDMCNFNISNVGTINGITLEGLSNWANYPAVSNVDVGSNEIYFTNKRIRQGAGYQNVVGNSSIEFYTPITNASSGRMASVIFSKISGGVIDYTSDTLLYAFNVSNPARLQTQSQFGTENIAYLSDVGVRPSFDIYVTPNGNDTTGDGSSQKPFLTIGRALTLRAGISSGVEVSIQVNSGTYTETFTIPSNTYVVGVVAGEVRQPTNVVGVVTFSGADCGFANITLLGSVVCNTGGGVASLNAVNITSPSGDIAVTLTTGNLFMTECRVNSGLGNVQGIVCVAGTLNLRDVVVLHSGGSAQSAIVIGGSCNSVIRQSYITMSSTSTLISPIIQFTTTSSVTNEINFCRLNYTSTAVDAGGNKCCIQFANISGTITSQIANCILQCVGAVTGGNRIEAIQKTGAGSVNLTYGANETVSPASFISSGVTRVPMTRIDEGVYGCFASSITTTVTGANVPTLVNHNIVEVGSGVLGISGGNINLNRAGNYEVSISIQLTKSSGGSDFVYFWLRLNGTDVLRSASTIRMTGNGAEVLANVTAMISANAGDALSVVFGSADNTVQAIAIGAQTTPMVVPAIPSCITSVKLLN
jgi:hypothetical protein